MFPGQALAVELDCALTDDPLIDELAFVPSASMGDLFGPNQDTHPQGAVTSSVKPGSWTLVEHKLAIAVTSLVPLYTFAAEGLRRADQVGRREDTLRVDSSEDTFEKKINKSVVGVCSTTNVDVVRLLLLVNGDHLTAWNRRKVRMLELVDYIGDAKVNRSSDDQTKYSIDTTEKKSKISQLASRELKFAECVLSKFPKAQSVWAHRRWVILILLKGITPDQFEQEVAVTNTACLRKRLNYAAWRHRRWCALGATESDGVGVDKKNTLNTHRTDVPDEAAQHDSNDSNDPNTSTSTVSILSELTSISKFVKVNVSDYCGLHYRQALLERLIWLKKEKKNDEIEINWTEELSLISDLISRYPGREALWVHRRFLCDARLREAVELFGLDSNNASDSESHEIVASELTYAETFFSRKGNGDMETSTSTSPEILHTSWATHPAADQVRFASAHALWVLEAGRRVGVLGAVGTNGAEKRRNAAAALEVHWPWGQAAARGMRRREGVEDG
jgi:hypothetical protein